MGKLINAIVGRLGNIEHTPVEISERDRILKETPTPEFVEALAAYHKARAAADVALEAELAKGEDQYELGM